jgi:MoaA/NifB/PqqE/SkfB family radical SAM enzyme
MCWAAEKNIADRLQDTQMGFVGNYLRNLGRLWLSREPIYPLMFSYYITHQCNLNCRYCSDGDGKRFKEDPIPELDTSKAKRLLSILRKAGDTLDITGGEPLLRDDLQDILEYAHSIGFRTVLNTKGIGLADRPDLLEYCDVLVLSLDTLNPDLLSELIGRPLGAAQDILAALDYALANRHTTNTKLVLSAVATPENLDEVERVLAFAMKHSLGFQLSPEIVGTAVNPLLRNNERYRHLIDNTMQTKHKQPGVFGVPEYLLGIKHFGRFRCHPLLMPVIRPDGRMYYPCLEWKQAEVDLLESGDYWASLCAARKRFGEIPACKDCCHIFCHMALSLLQTHPISALGELKHWRN